MIEYIEHIIKAGQRFDTIAYEYWGDTNLTPILVLDNSHISIREGLPEGEVMYVRNEISDEQLVNSLNLPPWRI